MLRTAALTFGVVFIAIGLLGFVPALTPDGNLLGIFKVDAVHNIVHLLSGIVALAAVGGGNYARLYFQVFGVVYALVTVIGFIQMTSILGIFVINTADNFLHVAIAAAALYLGFVAKPDTHDATPASV